MKNILTKLNPDALRLMQNALQKKERIALACSGGADSISLLLVAKEFFESEKILVLHYNHCVRKNSDADEAFVKKTCKRFSLKFASEKRKAKLKKISEEELRKLRLAFFERVCAKEKISIMLQGHIKNDVAETMLMRLARAASLEGLCAPRPVSELNNLMLARPLIDISKNELKDFLKQKKEKWREDESNAQNDFLRNKIRNIIIPQMEKFLPERDFFSCLARSRKLLEEDAKLLDEVLKTHCKKEKSNAFILDDFALSHIALSRRALQTLLSSANLNLRSSAADIFLKNISERKSEKISFKNFDLTFAPKTGKLALIKKIEAKDFDLPLRLGENILPSGAKIFAEKIKADKHILSKLKTPEFDGKTKICIAAGIKDLAVRKLIRGDKYRPIAAKSERLVKDMLSSKKVEILKRKNLPLVYSKHKNAVWVPELPPADEFKLVNSQSAIVLTYSE